MSTALIEDVVFCVVVVYGSFFFLFNSIETNTPKNNMRLFSNLSGFILTLFLRSEHTLCARGVMDD